MNFFHQPPYPYYFPYPPNFPPQRRPPRRHNNNRNKRTKIVDTPKQNNTMQQQNNNDNDIVFHIFMDNPPQTPNSITPKQEVRTIKPPPKMSLLDIINVGPKLDPVILVPPQKYIEEPFKIDLNKKYDELNCVITNINDLIELSKKYTPNHNYPINLKILVELKEPLEELNNLIGMSNVKTNIIDQILYYLQNFENGNMMHTVLYGQPGVGKTLLGSILSKIYYKMGILKRSNNAVNDFTGKKSEYNFRIVKRSELIGEYLGHTAVKTQKVIDSCKGGVLFIDEAYSLGNYEQKDSYSKECIDTINQNLTENKNNIICIIAGYEKELEKCFFAHNPGLKRRFPFVYNIEKYNAHELALIFIKMTKDTNWKLDTKLYDDIFEFIKMNYNKFKNLGGDMENLLFKCKLAHSNRVFGKMPQLKKILTLKDLENGLEIFEKNFKKEDDNNYLHLYN